MCARIHLHLHLRGIHADAYGDGNIDCNGDSNSYTYFNSETFTDAEIRANAQATSHAATAPVVIPATSGTAALL